LSQVSVTIGGKVFRMACDDGQEDRLVGLAARLDQEIERLRGEFGAVGDQRLTVMAGITMIDALSEAERRIGRLETEIASLEAAKADAARRLDLVEADMARAIEAAAEAIESASQRLATGVAAEN
jgi:cell division protein ZapA